MMLIAEWNIVALIVTRAGFVESIAWLVVQRMGSDPMLQGSKNPGFLKKPNPLGFWGFYWGFLDKQEKIGKIIQKLSNLKP